MKKTLKIWIAMLMIMCSLSVWTCDDFVVIVNAEEGELKGETGVEEVPDGFWGEETPTVTPTPSPEPAPTPSPEPAPTPSPEPAPTPSPEPAPIPTPEPVPTPSPDPEGDVSDVFPDVKDGAWYETGVQFVFDNDLMSGSNGMFHPTADITRAQIVTTLYRLAGSPPVINRSALHDFTDVKEGKYYTDAVCWAYAKGIATGNDGVFNPAGKLTRQQMAAFFFRFAEEMGMDTITRGDISSMINADQVSGYAKDPVEWAVGKGLISGSEVTDANGNKAYDLKQRGNTILIYDSYKF